MLAPRSITFTSAGTDCSAWHFPAQTSDLTDKDGSPCIVMGHGFGGTKKDGLTRFADAFGAAGIASFLFDYRGFGESDGRRRQEVDHRMQRQDFHAAVAAARGLGGVDPDRVAIWGYSYAGGHVLAVAADDQRIAAVVSQAGSVDSLETLALTAKHKGIGEVLRLSAVAYQDQIGSLFGRPPIFVPTFGDPGDLAVETAPDARPGFEAIGDPTTRTDVRARCLAKVLRNRPIRFAKRVVAPTLFLLGTKDVLVSPLAIRRAARRVPTSELVEMDAGHFDFFLGDTLATNIEVQVEFLTRVLRPRSETPKIA